MNTLLYLIIGVVVLFVLWAIWAYNRFIKLVNRTDEAWADIDVQLKRRYDLIPNLVSTVQGYAAHEKETFQNVTEARTQAMQAEQSGDVKATAQSENMLAGALKSLFAVAENYPDLKASENFKELQRELSDTENKIQASRRFYNGNVRDLNTSVQSFPQNVIAGMFSFSEREFFEIEEAGERDPVKVQF
ncbi:MAG: LemA family protein [Candidatus Paceibacterota bacterium]